jgi:DNA replication factor GINS
VKKLEEDVKKEEDPKKIKLFNEEIQNTKKIAFNIYELREKKIVTAALSTVRGGKPDLKNLLDVEKKLFDSLVREITASRRETLEGEKIEESREDEPREGKRKIDVKRTVNVNPIVLVLEDLPEFVGMDMKTYRLRRNDVVSLSKDMAEVLLKRGVAREIK